MNEIICHSETIIYNFAMITVEITDTANGHDNGLDSSLDESKTRDEETKADRETLTKIWIDSQRYKTQDSFEKELVRRRSLGLDRKTARAEESVTIIDEERSGLAPKKSTQFDGSSNGKRDEIIANGTNQNSNVKHPLLEKRSSREGSYRSRQNSTDRKSDGNGISTSEFEDGVKDLSELLFRKKLDSLGNDHDPLHLPSIGRSPFTSPFGSPAGSPRASIAALNELSPLSTPGSSPLGSPRSRTSNSLPRNFKEHLDQNTITAARSLPSSPIIRRARTARLSNKNSSMDTNSFTLQTTHDKLFDKQSEMRGKERFSSPQPSLDQRQMNGSSRRPGTPVARDLRPGLGLCQLSKSMSDLQSISENVGMKKRNSISRSKLLPSLCK